MASWRGEVDIPAPEVGRLGAVVPMVLERARALRVADGTLLDPWNGHAPLDLHVVAGTHPLVGARYEGTHRSVLADGSTSDPDVEPDSDLTSDRDDAVDEWPDAIEHLWAASIDADDARSAKVTIIDGAGTDDEISLAVEVPEPAHPTEVRFVNLLPVANDGFMVGHIETEGTISWDRLRSARDGSHRIATVHIGHPRFRAGIVADAEPHGDTWRITAEGFVSGRGMSRPLFALMMFFVARKLRPVLDRRLAELAEPVEQWNDLARAHPRDDELADAIVDQWLDHFRRA